MLLIRRSSVSLCESDDSQEVRQTGHTNNEELAMWDIIENMIKNRLRLEGSINIQEALNEGQEDDDSQELWYRRCQ